MAIRRGKSGPSAAATATNSSSSRGRKLRSRHGRGRPPADPLDQANVQALFQLPDLQADPRLGQSLALGRGGKAAELDGIGEGPEVIQVEAPIPKNLI